VRQQQPQIMKIEVRITYLYLYECKQKMKHCIRLKKLEAETQTVSSLDRQQALQRRQQQFDLTDSKSLPQTAKALLEQTPEIFPPEERSWCCHGTLPATTI